MAEEGTGNGLIVSFDTWDNVSAAVDSAHAIAVKVGGVLVATQSVGEPREGGRAPETSLITDPATGLPMTLYTGADFAPVVFRLNHDQTLDLWYKNVLIFNKVPVPGYTPQVGANLLFAARTGEPTKLISSTTSTSPPTPPLCSMAWSTTGRSTATSSTPPKSLAGSASTVADDGTFAGANGTGGIRFGAGLFGGAGIEQNGALGAAENDGYVHVVRSADTLAGATSTITTSLWLKTAGVDTNWQTILSHGEGAQYRIARRAGSIPPIASYAGGSGDIPLNDTTGTPIGVDNGWHHVVAISQGGVSTRLWIDGTLVATGGAPAINDNGNNNPPNPDLFIGANPQTGTQNREWWGEIDDVAQWNRVLNEGEIARIYGAGRFGAAIKNLVCPGLAVDFNSTNQDGPAHNQDGYRAYDAAHEVSNTFTTMSYDVVFPFTGAATVSVTPEWPNTTDPRVRQAIDRSLTFDMNWMGDKLDLLTDFIGSDSRTANGGNGDFDGVTGTPTYMTLSVERPPGG